MAWDWENVKLNKFRPIIWMGGLLLLLAGCVHGGGSTALHRAAQAGDLKAVERLLTRGANVNARDAQGNTPLHLLVARDSQPAPAKSDQKTTNTNDTAVLVVPAPLSGPNEASIAGMLLVNGADVNARNARGQTPLHLAVIHDKADLAGLLMASGADVTARDANGQTPADLALTRGLAGLIAILQAAQQGGTQQ